LALYLHDSASKIHLRRFNATTRLSCGVSQLEAAMNLMVVLLGLVLLVCLAVAVGGVDIYAQRAALRRIADARRDRHTRR
jgi:hypothetical protein